jgi:antitoxin component YwqK of YwqJK toxin-antitoxin module
MNISSCLIRINTQENFSVLNKLFLIFVTSLFFFSSAPGIFSEDWYISNAAGMSLEKTFSSAALREAYALNIEHFQENQIPLEISTYIDSEIVIPQLFNVELHTLYENGTKKNQRWILRYSHGNPWIVLSAKEKASGGFAEYYDESAHLIQEDMYFETYVLSNKYNYDRNILLQSETWQKPWQIQKQIDEVVSQKNNIDESIESSEANIHIWSDVYRYSRNGSLRSIERTFHSDKAEDIINLAKFAPLSPLHESTSVISSSPAISSDFISDIINLANTNIDYVTDEQGKIIAEIHTDDKGKKTGELLNTWSGDRLASIGWNGENDTRLIEYEYDEMGNRLIERNYRNGILERLVRIEEDGEVEELYLQGKLSLRAFWKDGQKISEEYFRQNADNLPRRNP